MIPEKCSLGGLNWRRLFVLSLLAALTSSRPCPAASSRMNVALVSGSDLPVYSTDQTLQKLKVFLEAYYPMDCVLVRQDPADGGFKNIEALAAADVGVFFVRRKTPPPKTLAAIQEFFRSGKGVVAIGPTSHGWENWKEFDLEVLGAKYDGPWEAGRIPTEIKLWPHPVFAGSEDYTHQQYVYNYQQFAADVRVLMEAHLEGKTMPIAWTRERNGARIFYLAPSVKDEFDKPGYLRIIANGVLWTARKEVPGVGTRILRTWMPDAHPASFAVGFPDGLNFCFDPERGQIAYAWDGDYLDLEPTYTGKFPRDAKIKGVIFHRAMTDSFAGNKSAKADVRFRGYSVQNGIPEFHYEVNGITVHESIRPKPDHSGLIRHFRIDGADGTLSYRAENPGTVTIEAGHAKWIDGRLTVPANSVVQFTDALPKP